ncbi:MAG: hydantoinase/oxoprolinase family protein [Dehalococcoidales bacterium]|nr:hydantoinase/oxoprolinase family protein [Dehalococcoidales bacterium]
MTNDTEDRYLWAQDAGGSMTDTLLVDKDGRFSAGKCLTNNADEAVSYVGSITDAASRWDMTAEDIFKGTRASIYAGTTMVNILVTREGSKVGLLVTRGFADMPVMERGYTWIGQAYEDVLHQQLHEHTPWLVQPENVKEVTERILGGSYYADHHIKPGTVIIPLLEEDVVQGVNELLDDGCEVLGILTLSSYVNPVHEKRIAEIAREIVKERGVDVRVVASHEICSLPNENERLKTVLLQCYMAEVARNRLFGVEAVAKEKGYKHELLTLLSYGAIANIRYPKLVEGAVSGPVGGVLGAKFLSKYLGPNVVCWDLGCTTCDVGLITGGLYAIDKEPFFANHRLRMPMVSIDSIGAGTSHVVHADAETKKINIGPESVRAALGTCWQASKVTIGDIDIALKMINPDYYLGGTVEISRERALKELEEQIAKPLGQELYQVSSKILDLLHGKVVDHINGILMAKGLEPSDFTLLVYGAAGPLHLWGVERSIKFGKVLIVPWSAVFSAFGVASADYFHRYDRSVNLYFTPKMTEEEKLAQGNVINQAFREMEQQGYDELIAEKFTKDQVSFKYGMSARYVGQIFSWEVPLATGEVKSLADVDTVIDSFEKAYSAIYPAAARYPEIGYQVTDLYVEAVGETVKPVIQTYPLQGKTPPKEAYKGQREAYMDGKWQKFDLWEMELLDAGNVIEGPAIVEHPMTTLLIPSTNYVELDERKFIWYKRKE